MSTVLLCLQITRSAFGLCKNVRAHFETVTRVLLILRKLVHRQHLQEHGMRHLGVHLVNQQRSRRLRLSITLLGMPSTLMHRPMMAA